MHGRRPTVRAHTEREARAKLRELHRKAEEDTFVPDERLTVAEYLEYWLTVVEPSLRPSTLKRYGEYARVHAIPEIGRLRLSQLKPMHLQDLYESRLQAGCAPSTVHHLHAMLRRALGMAERWELVNRNVAQRVSPPRVPSTRSRRSPSTRHASSWRRPRGPALKPPSWSRW
ncbi:MAG TPA: N-terminal phage integrase SAM-like domain-containing protein [Polyangia bacterium]